jgi:TM2 domain-containing membrane protein YozV
MASSSISRRSRLVALLLCWFLGIFGAHRFYAGRPVSAVFMILTLGGLGIWALVDLIIIICGAFRDAEGNRIFKWMEPGA